MTLEQFLVWESTQELKHEYYRGRVMLHNVSMPGGSTSHNRIERNLVVALANAVRGSECEAFTSNQLVMSVARRLGFYPDASVFCEPLQKRRYGTLDAATNPAVVFEVFSPSTWKYDQTHKLEVYQTIPSMREIFLVSSDEQRVERNFRVGDGWDFETYVGDEGSFPVLDRPILLADVYEGVDFPGEEA